jgi:Kef-type K+ transport system membrane component KefB
MMADGSRLILQVGVILVVARLMGKLFSKIGQPQVIGEMAGGILLGPSLLGWVAPGIFNAVFQASSIGHLVALSQVGLVLFMFMIGLSLNSSKVSGNRHAAVLISHVSMVIPFCAGALIALYLYPRMADDSYSFTGFALFMGASMSVTAFPVLARILTERNLLDSRVGSLSIACAAVDDVTGWCVLAYVVVTIRASRWATPAYIMALEALAYAILMLFAVKPLLAWLERSFTSNKRLTENAFALMVLLMLASALITEWLGLHVVFGAFFMGAIMPRNREFTRHVLQKFESLTVVVLLPLFFGLSGLRMSINVIRGPEMWGYALLVIVAAVVSKLGGSMIAARWAGIGWKDAAALGILMNTRGLMELIILNVGLEIGAISQAVFSIMVLMALVTTFMTAPLLSLLYPAGLDQAGKSELRSSQVASK